MALVANRRIVGIDGGGTGCRIVVSDATGAILGRAEGAAANIATDFETSHRNILDAVVAAYRNAGLSQTLIGGDVALLGLAGAGVGDLACRLEMALPFFRNRVIEDRKTTVEGALGDDDGCVAVIGTGSFFVGRHGSETIGIGGWGFHIGDDGSGARLGKELLRRVVLCHDGLASHSDLTREVLTGFGGTPAGIVEFSLTAQPRDYGEFAPRIVAAVTAGDAVATAILTAAKDIVQRALDRVGLAVGDPLCLLGGLGPVYGDLLDPEYRAHCRPPKGDALAGALALARREFADVLEITV